MFKNNILLNYINIFSTLRTSLILFLSSLIVNSDNELRAREVFI
jgi:hypothetical protein